NTRTGGLSRAGGTATNTSRAPTSILAALGCNTGRSSKHIPLFRFRPLHLASFGSGLFACGLFIVARFLSVKQRPSCASEDILPNGISWGAQLLTTALRTEPGTTLLRSKAHHCTDGLLPLPVALFEDAPILAQAKFLPALPRPPPGPNAIEELHHVAATRTERRQHVQVTSPKETSGPRRYAVVSTPTCDLNRTGRSSGITCEMAILREVGVAGAVGKDSLRLL